MAITGTTRQPLKCSWPLSRSTPIFCNRVRSSAPAFTRVAGRRKGVIENFGERLAQLRKAAGYT